MTAIPRSEWLAEQVPQWAAKGEKCLVFVRGVERLTQLVSFLESKTRTRVNVFHEDLPVAKRDIEVAGFRESTVPLLVSTEAGGEGRKLPVLSPHAALRSSARPGRNSSSASAASIGLDADAPVEILYFRTEASDAKKGPPDLARLYEGLAAL